MPKLPPRCMNTQAAARYCSVSLGTFKKHGPVPIYIGSRRVYDIVALNRWLDRLGGHASFDDAEALALEALDK